MLHTVSALVAQVQELMQSQQQSQDTQPLTLKELTEALTKLKKRRAPGPDQNANESLLLLDDDNLDILLQHCNDIWTSGRSPKIGRKQK